MRKAKNLWHDANKERPTESGYYIIYNGGMVSNVSYSKKHDAFNATDNYTECKFEPQMWTTYEELGLPKRED